MQSIWLLGAYGRSGRVVTKILSTKEVDLVLVGRDEAQLQKLVESLPTNNNKKPRLFVSGSLETIADEISKAGPVTVVNFFGPFYESMPIILKKCQPGSRYCDLNNDFVTMQDLFKLENESKSKNFCLVGGAGFGVLGSETLAYKILESHSGKAKNVRIDSFPFVKSEGGTMGQTLARTIVEGIPVGSRCFQNGRLIKCGFGAEFHEITLPDGQKLGAGAVPLGDLIVVQNVTQAPSVLVASGMVPSSSVVRNVLFPLVSGIMSFQFMRDFAVKRMAKLEIPPTDSLKEKREFSFLHGKVEFEDMSVSEGWLKLGDASDFTNKVCAEVAFRLAKGDGKAGVFTPATLFGKDFAMEFGAEFILL